jgi:tRNA modification GTPase
VTEVPGTTRDAIEATADVDGWPLRLADTAGLHDTDDRLERLGIEVSRRWLAAADLVLLCVEAGRGPEPGEREMLDTHPCLLVRTKADLAPQPGPGGGLAVSALTGRGLGELRQALSERLFGGLRGGDMEPLLTRERHRTALQRGSAALAEAMAELETGGGDAVLVAHHLRQAVTALDELVGLVDVEEVLGRVFARFCVGK